MRKPKWVDSMTGLWRSMGVTGYDFVWNTRTNLVDIIHQKTGTRFGEYDHARRIFRLEGGGWKFDCTWDMAARHIMESIETVQDAK